MNRNNVVMVFITLAWAVRKTMKTLLWQWPSVNQELHQYTSETSLLGPACFIQVFPSILKFVFTVHLRDEYITEAQSTYMEESKLFSFSIHQWLSDTWQRLLCTVKRNIHFLRQLRQHFLNPLFQLHFYTIYPFIFQFLLRQGFLNLYVLLSSHTNHIYDLPV
jgi:hypothetical protein